MTRQSPASVAVLGIFVADTSFRAPRQPNMGETLLGSRFSLGPGGKGSNQAVAIARLGVPVSMVTSLGTDDFAEIAYSMWETEGVTPVVTKREDSYTGAAYIFIEEPSGNNAIIVCPGAATTISAEQVEAARATIEGASVFITQLEQPVEAAHHGLTIARSAGVITIFNPAPAVPVDDAIFALCDYVTPNESETEALTGLPVKSVDDAREAADALLAKGVGTAVITLGENGVLVHSREFSEHLPAVSVGPVVETTGAGDAFNGGMAAALARGMAPLQAARFGCAVAGISVTRPGTAPSMPTLAEAEAVFGKKR